MTDKKRISKKAKELRKEGSGLSFINSIKVAKLLVRSAGIDEIKALLDKLYIAYEFDHSSKPDGILKIQYQFMYLYVGECCVVEEDHSFGEDY